MTRIYQLRCALKYSSGADAVAILAMILELECRFTESLAQSQAAPESAVLDQDPIGDTSRDRSLGPAPHAGRTSEDNARRQQIPERAAVADPEWKLANNRIRSGAGLPQNRSGTNPQSRGAACSMSEQTSGGAFYASPTFGQRVRWALGYRRRFNDFDEVPEGCPHWAMTEVFVKFSFLDRLRLLLNGAVMLHIGHQTDVPVARWFSKTSVSLIGPGDYRLKQHKRER